MIDLCCEYLSVYCSCMLSLLWWPITATAITKRSTVNKEILINKKKFCSHIKKVCFCFQLKKICSHGKKVCLHTKNNPTANSTGKFSRKIATANRCGKFPRQIATANSHGKTSRQIAAANSYGK